MTTTPGTATAELAPERAPLSTPRGRTTVAPAVVEKIVLKAATEVDGVGPVVHTGLGRLVPWVASGAPGRAEAEVGRESVTVDFTVAVRYPLPVRQVAASLRQHATRRIEDLTGLAVRQVNVTVADLLADETSPGRRVE